MYWTFDFDRFISIIWFHVEVNESLDLWSCIVNSCNPITSISGITSEWKNHLDKSKLILGIECPTFQEPINSLREVFLASSDGIIGTIIFKLFTDFHFSVQKNIYAFLFEVIHKVTLKKSSNGC